MTSVKTRRELAAAETQRVIVDTASRLFLDHGYNATSIAQIAAEAGVALQTIYNSVGSKRELLSRVLDSGRGGGARPRPSSSASTPTVNVTLARSSTSWWTSGSERCRGPRRCSG